jgi:hypothetical protein
MSGAQDDPCEIHDSDDDIIMFTPNPFAKNPPVIKRRRGEIVYISSDTDDGSDSVSTIDCASLITCIKIY